jgi:hypothetical protein
VSIGRTDGCTAFILGFGGVYWRIDGVGNVKFVIWTGNKQRNVCKICIVNKIRFGHDARLC